jgi:hypothetical protein
VKYALSPISSHAQVSLVKLGRATAPGLEANVNFPRSIAGFGKEIGCNEGRILIVSRPVAWSIRHAYQGLMLQGWLAWETAASPTREYRTIRHFDPREGFPPNRTSSGKHSKRSGRVFNFAQMQTKAGSRKILQVVARATRVSFASDSSLATYWTISEIDSAISRQRCMNSGYRG